MEREDQPEWTHGPSVPFINGATFEVWTDTGDVVECRREPTLDYSNLFRTGDLHPMANRLVSNYRIRAWRIKAQEAPAQSDCGENPVAMAACMFMDSTMGCWRGF